MDMAFPVLPHCPLAQVSVAVIGVADALFLRISDHLESAFHEGRASGDDSSLFQLGRFCVT